MWDDKRKVGILNDFDLARFADQDGASGQDNTGTLPFMALDLLSKEGLRGEIPRRYRHEAESFTWSLICLCLATVEDENGRNYTLSPHPLLDWFQDPTRSRYYKKGLEWSDHDNPNIALVHPNAKFLSRALHNYWMDRYTRQFPRLYENKPTLVAREIAGLLGRETPQNPPEAPPPYQEPQDDDVFGDVLVAMVSPLDSAPTKEIQGDLVRMTREFQYINWGA